MSYVYVLFEDAALIPVSFFFFFNDTATTEIYTLSLHDALPIFLAEGIDEMFGSSGDDKLIRILGGEFDGIAYHVSRSESTRLNSSHANISYAVFCLKKTKTHQNSYVNRDLSDKSTTVIHYYHSI